MATMRLNLLGPVQVHWAEGKPPRFRSPAAVGLLGYLVVEGRVLSRTTVAALFWPGQPESQARGELRRVLHNLSTIVPGCIEATNQTVAFDAGDRCEVDVQRFQSLVAVDHRHALEQAVMLYRAEFLEGLYLEDAPEFEAWLAAARERWRRAAVDALQRLADLCRQEGDQAGAMHAATRLLALDPWREETHRLMMRLLARSGQWNAALSQYQTCADILARELGVAPTPETTALYERILAARTAPRHNLPSQRTPFVGREEEQATLVRRLRDPACWLVTLTGPGGVGKTRLAQQVGLLLNDDFLNGVRYVSLGAMSTPEFLPTAMATSLDLALAPRPSPQEQIVAHLQEREMLLILDECEHLLDGVDLLAQILRDAAHIKLLVTSRQRLGLQEEWVFMLDGLPYPPAQSPPQQSLDYAAVQLFEQNARRVQSDFSLVKADSLASAARICRLLQGSPLGIELAAALVPRLSNAQIAAEIEENMDVLHGAWRNAPPGHRSLRAVFERSRQLLALQQRDVLRRLSVFRGGFTLAAAVEVADLSPEALATLQAKCFVRQSGEGNGTAPRYEMHATLQQYAAEELASDPRAQRESEERHSAYFAGLLAAQDGRFITDLAAVKAALLPHMDNVRRAWQRAVEWRDWAQVDRMLGSLHNLYEVQGWYQEGSELLLAALAAADGEALSAALRGRLFVHAAGTLLRLGRLPQAHELVTQGLSLLRGADDAAALGHALNTLGILHIYKGEFPAAAATLRECIDLYRQSGIADKAVRPLANLGSLLGRQGDYEASLQILEEGLELCRELDDRRGEALFLNNLGGVHLMRGDLDAAERYLEASLPISEEVGHLQNKVVALQNLAEIHLGAGRLQEAMDAGEQSAALARELHDRPNLARSLKMQGVAATMQGSMPLAWQHLREGLQIAYATQALPALMDVLQGVAAWLAATGQQSLAAQVATIIVDHPATEQQHRDQARATLSQLAESAGVTTEDGELPTLEEVVSRLLRKPLV